MRLKIRKKSYILLFIIPILFMTIGYSYLKTNLNIDGYTSLAGRGWNIHFENLSVKNGSKAASVPAEIDDTKLCINFTVTFDSPGNYYEFIVDVVNGGDIDAMLAEYIKIGYDESLEQYLEYTIKYNDGEALSAYNLLRVGDRETIKVRVAYKKDAPKIESDEDLVADLGIELSYIQAEDATNRITNERTIKLKDGSEWYLIDTENIDDTVRLLSKYNLKKENNKYVQDKTGGSNPIAYDSGRGGGVCGSGSHGCNIYGTAEGITTDSLIKMEVESYQQQLLNDGIINANTSIDLITLDELEDLGCDSQDRERVGSCTGTYSWIYSKNYWTRTDKPAEGWYADVWVVNTRGKLTFDEADNADDYGLRPVLETTYANLNELTGAHSLTTKEERTVAVWMWHGSVLDVIQSDKKIDQHVKMLKELGINTLYMGMQMNASEKYTKFIKTANANNIKIYALFGDPAFVFEKHYNQVVNYNMNMIAIYNAVHAGEAYLEGVHYDVEYHGAKLDGQQCGGGQTEENKRCFARKYFVDFVRAAGAQARKLGIEVQHDVSLWNTQFATFYDDDDTEKVIIDEVIANSTGISPMTYGNCTRNSIKPIIYGESDDQRTYIHGKDTENPMTIEAAFYQKVGPIENFDIIVGQEFVVFKNTAKELEDDPSLYGPYLPEYTGQYTYTRSFIRRIQEEIRDAMDPRLEQYGKKVGFAFHHYTTLLEVLNLPE